MAEAPAGPNFRRIEAASYGAALFSIGGGSISAVAVPLMLLALGTPAYAIGILMGARHILPVLFAIHTGTLMDKLGPRRVMVVCGLIATFIPVLYPLTSMLWLVAVLQALVGFAGSTCWVGAQTVVGKHMKGNATVAGRLSFAVQTGGLISPALSGLAWDWFGEWGAFGFMSLWGLGLLIAALMLPKKEDGAGAQPVSLSVLVPRWRDYWETGRMMREPAVAVVVIGSMLNIVSAGIEASFYVVYLEKIGLSATLMGLLLATAGGAAAVGCLIVEKFERRINGFWLLLLSIVVATVSIGATSFCDSFLPLLLLSVLRGLGWGFGQPLMITLLARATGAAVQGRCVGLRNTANRLTNSALPILMGVVVEFVGLEASFPLVCSAVMVGVAWLAWFVARTPKLRGLGSETA
jgi:MFS family permease